MKKRLVLYLALSFTPAWVLWSVLNVLPLSVPMQTLGTALGMFSPMLAAMLTARLCGDRRIFPLHPHIHRNLPFYLLAWLGVPLLGLAGGTLYFACFPPSLTLICPTSSPCSHSPGFLSLTPVRNTLTCSPNVPPR